MAADPVESREEPSSRVRKDLDARIKSEPLRELVSVRDSVFTSTTVPDVVVRRSPPMRRLEAPQELRRLESSTTPSASVVELPIVMALVELMSILDPRPPELGETTFPRSAIAVTP